MFFYSRFTFTVNWRTRRFVWICFKIVVFSFLLLLFCALLNVVSLYGCCALLRYSWSSTAEMIWCRVQAYFPVEVLWFWTVFAIVCVTIGQGICLPLLRLQRRFRWTLLPLISVEFLIMIVTHHHVYPLRLSDSILYNSRILWIDTKWKWRYCTLSSLITRKLFVPTRWFFF